MTTSIRHTILLITSLWTLPLPAGQWRLYTALTGIAHSAYACSIRHPKITLGGALLTVLATYHLYCYWSKKALSNTLAEIIISEPYNQDKHPENLINHYAETEADKMIQAATSHLPLRELPTAQAKKDLVDKILQAIYRDLHQTLIRRTILINSQTGNMIGYY